VRGVKQQQCASFWRTSMIIVKEALWQIRRHSTTVMMMITCVINLTSFYDFIALDNCEFIVYEKLLLFSWINRRSWVNESQRERNYLGQYNFNTVLRKRHKTQTSLRQFVTKQIFSQTLSPFVIIIVLLASISNHFCVASPLSITQFPSSHKLSLEPRSLR
jgi:hypothetical protein